MRQTTKEAIAQAFEGLLEKRSIDKITVKDIVAECGVNRQTFYYHFRDIYDLMEWTLAKRTGPPGRIGRNRSGCCSTSFTCTARRFCMGMTLPTECSTSGW